MKYLIFIVLIFVACSKPNPIKHFSAPLSKTAFMPYHSSGDEVIAIWEARDNSGLDGYIITDSLGWNTMRLFDPNKTTAEEDFILKMGYTKK